MLASLVANSQCPFYANFIFVPVLSMGLYNLMNNEVEDVTYFLVYVLS